MKEKFYYVYNYDPCGGGIIVKAKSVRETRKIGYREFPTQCEYIYIRAKLIRDVDKEFMERFKVSDHLYKPPSCETCFQYFFSCEEAKNHECSDGECWW